MEKVIASIKKAHYKTTFSNGSHEYIGDEPSPHGENLGPNPYDYLLSALDGCICMTIRMYVDHKKLDLESVEVHLTQKRVHHSDFDDCENQSGYIHIIEKEVKLTGNLTDKEQARLMDIANKCPVHKTLTNEIIIR